MQPIMSRHTFSKRVSTASNLVRFAALSLCSIGTLLSPVSANDIVPAPAQSSPILLTHGTLHTVIGDTLVDNDILIDNGKIIAIGQGLTHEGADIIDVSGKHLYPGLIALDTSIGLVEIGMVRSTVDSWEVGEVNPNLNTQHAYNPDSEIIPTIRYNGISHAQIVPTGDGIAGQSELVSLDAWTIEDALVTTQAQIHVYWPELGTLAADEEEKTKQLETHAQKLHTLKTAFEDGYRYFLATNAGQSQLADPKLKAMLPLYQGKAQLFVHADSQLQLEQVVALARQYHFNLVIVGGYDAWRLASQLSEINARVIYPYTFSLPKRKDEPVDLPFKIPALLKHAGIPFALGFSSDWNSRNLPFAAGQTVAYGLTQEEALKAITLDAAKMLNITDMGALSVGFKANIIVAQGDILDPMTAKIDAMYIEGRQIDLNNRQQQLYQKYLKR